MSEGGCAGLFSPRPKSYAERDLCPSLSTCSVLASSLKAFPISRLDKTLNPHPETFRCHYEMTFGSAIENIRFGIYFKK